MVTLEKDSYAYQRARVERIAGELAPEGAGEFDETSTMVKFRIRHKSLTVDLIEPFGEWFPSELADKSDDWLRQSIKNRSHGKIR